jgi:hypothetical protein
MKATVRERPGFAFLASAALTAAIIAAALQQPFLFPFAAIVVLIPTALVGMPLYHFARAQDWVNGWTAASAGAITGAALPALLVGSVAASLTQPDPMEGAWEFIAIFALLGALMGIVYFTMLRWGSHSRRAQLGLGGGAAVLAGLGIALFALGFDHSCHNPGIRGAMARYSEESFTVAIPESEWPKLRGEVERFARERGWSALHNTDDGRETVEICTMPGPLINARYLDGQGTQTRYYVSVEDPLKSDPDFRAKFRTLYALQNRIAARWPGAIRADEVTRLEWMGAPNGRPNPMFAPPAPSPAPSSAAR